VDSYASLKIDSLVDHGFLSLLFAVFACAAALDHKPLGPASAATEGSFRWTGSEDYSGLDFVETAQVLICMGSKSTTLATIQAQSLIAVTQASWNTLAGEIRFARSSFLSELTIHPLASPSLFQLFRCPDRA